MAAGSWVFFADTVKRFNQLSYNFDSLEIFLKPYNIFELFVIKQK